MATKKDPIATKAGFKAFRENEPNWNPPLGEHWKFLGRIASTRAAVIAHYRYENEEADEDDEDPKHTKNLVLKVHYPIDKEGNRPNGYPKNYRGHRYEEQFLYDLSGYYQYAAAGKKLVPPRPKNILRQYGSQLVHYGESEEPYNISFLEYCPGVVWNEARRYNLDVFDGCEFIEEIDIWLIFKQFTRMLMMMDTGNEVFPETEATRRRQPWWGHEICHYDIEPRNILIGYRDDEKDRVPQLKLCDFGDALDVPPFEFQDKAGFYKPSPPIQLNGREGYRTPEAVIGDTEHVQLFRHGSCSNVFQIGNIIRLLMHGKQSSDMDLHPNDGEWIEGLGPYNKDKPLTYARSLDDPENKRLKKYSKGLKNLIKKCMYEKPMLRPRTRNLWFMVLDGWEECDARYQRDEIPPPPGKEDVYRKPAREGKPYPDIHPIFQKVEVAPKFHRTPNPDWLEWVGVSDTPDCTTPSTGGHQNMFDFAERYEGDDLPQEDHSTYPRSRPMVPPRQPHGYPMIDNRPSRNLPDRPFDEPGGITRNLELMKYYDRLGHMWMGEENYWKMLEAGLDPQTYNWGMRIPDPEKDEDQGALSGQEFAPEEKDKQKLPWETT